MSAFIKYPYQDVGSSTALAIMSTGWCSKILKKIYFSWSADRDVTFFFIIIGGACIFLDLPLIQFSLKEQKRQQVIIYQALEKNVFFCLNLSTWNGSTIVQIYVRLMRQFRIKRPPVNYHAILADTDHIVVSCIIYVLCWMAGGFVINLSPIDGFLSNISVLGRQIIPIFVHIRGPPLCNQCESSDSFQMSSTVNRCY